MSPALIAVIIASAAALIYWLVWQNITICITRHSLTSDRLKSPVKIVHISDLHNTRFLRGQKRLLFPIAEFSPDIIVISGDLMYKFRPFSHKKIMELIDGAVKLCPVYFSPGNHELERPAGYAALKEELIKKGVHILEDAAEDFRADITLAGLCDPTLHAGCRKYEAVRALHEARAKKLAEGFCEKARLLISHHPEHIELYRAMGADFVFTGHAHGGQWRLPLIGGLYASAQGLFPRYTAGIIRRGSTSVIISRGVGKSLMPFRFLNRPELLFITIKTG